MDATVVREFGVIMMWIRQAEWRGGIPAGNVMRQRHRGLLREMVVVNSTPWRLSRAEGMVASRA